MTALGVLLLLAALGAVAWSSVRREREVDPDGALGGPGASRGLGARAVVLGVLVVAAGAVAAARLLSVLV